MKMHEIPCMILWMTHRGLGGSSPSTGSASMERTVVTILTWRFGGGFSGVVVTVRVDRIIHTSIFLTLYACDSSGGSSRR
jgi:hypothetical protein